MNEQTEPNCDNELVLPWAGLMFRYQDLRHYYFFCLQNPAAEEKKIVLYRRADNDWHILAEEPFQVDTTKYYSLKAKLQGNRIYCYLDGSELFRATDYLYTQGKAGVRFNTDSRVKSINITMTKGEQHIFQSAKNKHEEEVDAIREEYPKPVLWKKLDFSHLWPFGCRFVNLRSAEFKDLLLLGREQLVAADLEGEVLWQKEGRISIHNIISRPDGKVEIPALSGKEIIIFDGANGQTLKAAPAPSTGKPRRRPSFDIKTVNLSDTSWSIILKLGAGKDLWAYDEDLKLIWTTSVKPDYGHSNSVIFYDVDGDGSKEILAGSTLLSPAGETIWQVEGYEEILNYKSRGCAWHVDSCVMGDFADDEEVDPVAFLSASSCGVWVVDALTGKVRNIHYVGHAQGTSVGNFRPDTAGLEVLVGTRWGNYGILNLFSGRGERLLTFEPDNISQGGPPANWTGDGRDLILLATSPQALGLWDGWGRKVVTFPVEDLPEKTTDYYRNWAGCLNLYGDSRDEVIFCAQGKIHIFTPE
ncbi:MAG: hypothetical protein AMS15_05270 [Planctomycetes bacterium DG_23]|nr:MAG: hypothetical protein AMS15_05270 [Planctomycetes bacterium DG_23]